MDLEEQYNESSPHLSEFTGPSVPNNAKEADDDDPLTLSPYALEALKEFLTEQHSAAAAVAETAASGASSSEVSLISEDWRLSQFWYTPETAETVSEEVLELLNCLTTDYRSVACIACPTLFAYLKKANPYVCARLLEYDKRFEQYGSDFTFYDYNQPEELPQALKNAYQIVVADPPYLSLECLEKVSQTIAFLARPDKFYLLLLTGEVQRESAAKLLGLHPCGFRPQHSSKLGNEFWLFTNYDPGNRLGGWQSEDRV
ncbi:hypothetical protein Nepgr_011535 [Nepenthes gracilis]|uniref:Protein-lysine N-methyltransferase Nepgr_011535 n=1 Tax=Nepenthes gracilis TaxID=150966 RepID=A0AAD3SFI4_NEPGR|nr:hypothetical protein Nepgr_011535 [Nepenthes gracilis]